MEFIGVSHDGEKHTHIKGCLGDYATLCGLDGDDPSVGQFTVESGDKVDCPYCIMVWETARSVPPKFIDSQPK